MLGLEEFDSSEWHILLKKINLTGALAKPNH